MKLRAAPSTSLKEGARIAKQTMVHADVIAAKDAEIARQRNMLMQAYKFISPHSDPVNLSNAEMAEAIMAVLDSHKKPRRRRRC